MPADLEAAWRKLAEALTVPCTSPEHGQHVQGGCYDCHGSRVTRPLMQECPCATADTHSEDWYKVACNPCIIDSEHAPDCLVCKDGYLPIYDLRLGERVIPLGLLLSSLRAKHWCWTLAHQWGGWSMHWRGAYAKVWWYIQGVCQGPFESDPSDDTLTPEQALVLAVTAALAAQEPRGAGS